MKSIMRKLAAKKSQSIGRMAERLCEIALEQAGFQLIEKVEPAVICVKGKLIYKKQCSGDFRAVQPGTGKSVLVECKYRDRDHLVPSDFQEHQIKSLLTNHCATGISIVAHVDHNGCRLIYFPEAITYIGLPF